MRKLSFFLFILTCSVSFGPAAANVIVPPDLPAPTQPASCATPAPRGCSAPSLFLAKTYLQNEKFALAVQQLVPLAEKIPEAARLYGNLLITAPRGVRSDPESGVALLRKAIAAGDVPSAIILAGHYLAGRVPPDDVEAFRLLTLAAKTGDEVGVTNLSYMYLVGRGTKRDLHLYLKYAVIGAEAGRAAALGNIAYGYAKGEILPKDYRKAYFWYTAALDRMHGDDRQLEDKFLKARQRVGDKLSVNEIYKVDKAAKAWVPGPRSLRKVLKDERRVSAAGGYQDSETDRMMSGLQL